MDNYVIIIIVLAIVLMVFMALNHLTIVETTNTKQGSCSQTAFGCCPDGINSKINFGGKNCPIYNPGPGYFPPVTPIAGPGGPNPVASPYATPVAGPNPATTGAGPGGPLVSGPNTPPPGPGPKQSGGCIGSTYGCCPNTQNPRTNQNGTNC